MAMKRLARDESGQGVLEYILMLSIVVVGFLAVSRGLTRIQAAKALIKPINETFKYAYQYGHPDARGADDGGPTKHPRYSGGDNFRIFINPGR